MLIYIVQNSWRYLSLLYYCPLWHYVLYLWQRSRFVWRFLIATLVLLYPSILLPTFYFALAYCSRFYFFSSLKYRLEKAVFFVAFIVSGGLFRPSFNRSSLLSTLFSISVSSSRSVMLAWKCRKLCPKYEQHHTAKMISPVLKIMFRVGYGGNAIVILIIVRKGFFFSYLWNNLTCCRISLISIVLI